MGNKSHWVNPYNLFGHQLYFVWFRNFTVCKKIIRSQSSILLCKVHLTIEVQSNLDAKFLIQFIKVMCGLTDAEKYLSQEVIMSIGLIPIKVFEDHLRLVWLRHSPQVNLVHFVQSKFRLKVSFEKKFLLPFIQVLFQDTVVEKRFFPKGSYLDSCHQFQRDTFENLTPTVVKIVVRYKHKISYCVYPIHINIQIFGVIIMSNDT